MVKGSRKVTVMVKGRGKMLVKGKGMVMVKPKPSSNQRCGEVEPDKSPQVENILTAEKKKAIHKRKYAKIEKHAPKKDLESRDNRQWNKRGGRGERLTRWCGNVTLDQAGKRNHLNTSSSELRFDNLGSLWFGCRGERFEGEAQQAELTTYGFWNIRGEGNYVLLKWGGRKWNENDCNWDQRVEIYQIISISLSGYSFDFRKVPDSPDLELKNVVAVAEFESPSPVMAHVARMFHFCWRSGPRPVITAPQRTVLVRATDIPYHKSNILVFDHFDVETAGRSGGYCFTEKIFGTLSRKKSMSSWNNSRMQICHQKKSKILNRMETSQHMLTQTDHRHLSQFSTKQNILWLPRELQNVYDKWPTCGRVNVRKSESIERNRIFLEKIWKVFADIQSNSRIQICHRKKSKIFNRMFCLGTIFNTNGTLRSCRLHFISNRNPSFIFISNCLVNSINNQQ